MNRLLAISAVFLTAFSTLKADDLSTGLIVHYPLNWSAVEKISGTAGELLNEAVWGEAGLEFQTWRAGLWSAAGVGNGITNRISIALWVRPDHVNGLTYDYQPLVVKGRTSPVPYNFRLMGGYPVFTWNYGAAGQGELMANELVPQSTWHHFAVTSDGTKVRIYIDAQEKASQNASVNFVQEDAARLILDYDGFVGAMRDVRIYNRALSPQELAQLNAMQPPARLSTAYTGLWAGRATLNEVKEARTGTWGATPAAFQETVLLHVDDTGSLTLLQEATLMQTRVTPPAQPQQIVVTQAALLPNFDGITLRGGKHIGQRFSSASTAIAGGMVMLENGGGGAMLAKIPLPAAHPLNPFRHKYHPDLATGRELQRTLTLTLPPADSPSDNSITGTLLENIGGLHKTTLEARGPVTFTRVSTSGKLNQP